MNEFSARQLIRTWIRPSSVDQEPNAELMAAHWQARGIRVGLESGIRMGHRQTLALFAKTRFGAEIAKALQPWLSSLETVKCLSKAGAAIATCDSATDLLADLRPTVGSGVSRSVVEKHAEATLTVESLAERSGIPFADSLVARGYFIGFGTGFNDAFSEPAAKGLGREVGSAFSRGIREGFACGYTLR